MGIHDRPSLKSQLETGADVESTHTELVETLL